jgi:hypothetical protein
LLFVSAESFIVSQPRLSIKKIPLKGDEKRRLNVQTAFAVLLGSSFDYFCLLNFPGLCAVRLTPS